MAKQVDVVVAGHICLDIIPTLRVDQTKSEDFLMPGRLVRVGPATLALGGCVANTGIALHRLGATTRLVGKLGDDLLGKILLETLRQDAPQLSEHMIVAPNEATSYTVVINPPGVDRSFLHCAGVNDTFSATDLNLSTLCDSRILHFGYPPLMNKVAMDGGAGLAKTFQYAQREGVLTSLDMAMPDTTAGEQNIDWRIWLENVLPYVDLFLPSLDEILMMLDPDRFATLGKSAAGYNMAANDDLALLEKIASELIDLGVPIVVIKLGDRGLYLQTGKHTSQVLSARAAWKDWDWQVWDDLQAVCPCFDVDVVGATGAGDCTIAGFLMALLRGYGPQQTLRAASAVGARCVQSQDATSNIPAWEAVEQMVSSPHPQRRLTMGATHLTVCEETGVYHLSRKT